MNGFYRSCAISDLSNSVRKYIENQVEDDTNLIFYIVTSLSSTVSL